MKKRIEVKGDKIAVHCGGRVVEGDNLQIHGPLNITSLSGEVSGYTEATVSVLLDGELVEVLI